MLMATGSLKASAALKGRPPLRPCPDDFDVIFVEQGRLGCEAWYRAARTTIDRWLKERGKKRLIKARAAYVAHQRKTGEWITRQTRMVTHREIGAATPARSVRDRRVVSFTLARHAAQHLRIIRNGGFVVSPSSSGDWFVGSKRMSAAQMVDLAKAKGFDPDAVSRSEESNPNPPQAGHGYWGKQSSRPAHLQRDDEEGVEG